MSLCVLFLRGINVGGANMIKMKELTTLLEQLGLEDVRTYIQSGNVVCRAKKNTKELARRLGDEIEAVKGFRPNVLALSLEALEAAARKNPFAKGASDEPKSVLFYFLERASKSADLAALKALQSGSEEFKLAGDVFYLYAPDGVGRSKLAAKVEKHLGVSATARNWRTVKTVIEMARE